MNDPILHPTAERLQAFVENALDAGNRAIVESHVLGCALCQSEAEEWRSLFALLATLPQHAPSPKFADHIMAHVALPDPWYVRAAARVHARVHVFTPKTTRGWAFATACISLPMAVFGALVYWILSKPYITPTGLLAFAYERAHDFVSGTTSGALAGLLQSDIALFFVRGLETFANAGLRATGALLLGVAMLTALSAWFLYQNLFRTTKQREEPNYVSYSF